MSSVSISRMYACKYVIVANLPLPFSLPISELACLLVLGRKQPPSSTCEGLAPSPSSNVITTRLLDVCPTEPHQEPGEPQEPDLSPGFSFVCTRTLSKIDRECTREDRDPLESIPRQTDGPSQPYPYHTREIVYREERSLLSVRVDPQTRELVLLLAKRRGSR